jgi:hypothetical protein
MSEGDSETPCASTEGDHEAVERACDQIESLARSVKGLVLSSPSFSFPEEEPISCGPVETSVRMLLEVKDRAAAEMVRRSSGSWYVHGTAISSKGITKLARPFLEDMNHHVNKDVFDKLVRPEFSEDGPAATCSTRVFSDKLKEVLVKLETHPERPVVSYFHDNQMVLVEEFARQGLLCVCAEMPMGSRQSIFCLSDKEKATLPRLGKIFGDKPSVCLVGCIDLVLVDMVTGEITVAEVKTKNLLRARDPGSSLSRTGFGYPTCPRVTRPDLFQTWFYAYMLDKLYHVPVKNLMVLRTDVTRSELAVTRTLYEHVDVWGEEFLSVDVFKRYML